MRPRPSAGCGKSARPVRRAATGNGTMVWNEAPVPGESRRQQQLPKTCGYRASRRLYPASGTPAQGLRCVCSTRAYPGGGQPWHGGCASLIHPAVVAGSGVRRVARTAIPASLPATRYCTHRVDKRSASTGLREEQAQACLDQPVRHDAAGQPVTHCRRHRGAYAAPRGCCAVRRPTRPGR